MKTFRCHHIIIFLISKYIVRKLYHSQIFISNHISSYNHTEHTILMNEISLILPKCPQNGEEKRSIIALLITGFIGLVYESISTYLHNKRQKALHKAFIAMENEINLQHNKVIHLEDFSVMYGIYNSETLEILIDTVHKMYNSTTQNEKTKNLILGIIGI